MCAGPARDAQHDGVRASLRQRGARTHTCGPASRLRPEESWSQYEVPCLNSDDPHPRCAPLPTRRCRCAARGVSRMCGAFGVNGTVIMAVHVQTVLNCVYSVQVLNVAICGHVWLKLPPAVAQAQTAAHGHQGPSAPSHQQWWPKPNSHQRYRRALSSGWPDIGSRTSTSPACGAVREKRALASTTTYSQGVVPDSNVVLVASLLLSSETQPQGGHELRAGPRWPEAGYYIVKPFYNQYTGY